MLYIKMPDNLKLEKIGERDFLIDINTRKTIDLQSTIFEMLQKRGGKKTSYEAVGEIQFYFKCVNLAPPYLKYQINKNGKLPSLKTEMITNKPLKLLTTAYGQDPLLNIFGEKRNKLEEKRREKKENRRTKGPGSY